MNEPTEAQIKEFWEKIADEVGVYNEGRHYHFRFGDEWYRGKQTSFASGIPVIDLNNLFKYAVPRIVDGDSYTIKISRSKYHTYINIMPHYADLPEYKFGGAYDPALALFWAIWQVKETSNE